ncbi:sulfotransferase [Actinomadura sp. 7K507]|uniref:sulfotransferase family protein n=1 Tax=Actinomadura sp. 7K507 TaxID=2530365 RepID=UPI0010457C5C|nr:sulfotransferase [Actinomadura sp. 7K507]TDC82470.1 sulfotransferase [Actinomadura sp. 7K507]
MTLWTPPPRTAGAAAVYAAAEADRAARPERYRLGADEADAVVDRATRGGGRDLLGDPSRWRDGLERYLRSAAEDGGLNAVGAKAARGTAVARLRARISMNRHLAEHPETTGRPLLPPIVIVGGWRTGTTFLFRLLATDPRLRAPLPAELASPWSFAGVTGQKREDLLEAASGAHDVLHHLNPTLAAVHDSGARLPEECVLAMGTDFRNWGFSSTMRLDGYTDWLAGQDLAGSYARYREILQTLDAGDGRRWVLKAPAHTPELSNLAAAFPGACIVHLHRDIVETIASGASLFAVFRSTYSDEVDARDVGRFQADQSERWLRRAAAFRESPATSRVAVLDMRYRDLVSATAAALRQIYDAAGLDAPADVDGMIERYHADRPRHAKGVHRYAAADFGLDEDGLRRRFAFYEAPGSEE